LALRGSEPEIITSGPTFYRGAAYGRIGLLRRRPDAIAPIVRKFT
jgi:hypothetical protein